MPLSILFWVIMIVWLVFGVWSSYTPGQPYPFRPLAVNFLLFILFCLLGWAQFGAPVK